MLPKSHCLSPFSTTSSLSPSTPTTPFQNHYAMLHLDHRATTAEIKAQFRRLRGAYFATDVRRYWELQAAYAVLVDWEARREYDGVFRKAMGEKTVGGGGGTRATAAVQSFAKQQDDDGEATAQELPDRRAHDANWGLKHFAPMYEPLIGSVPYHSYIPVAEGYERGMRLTSQRPKYVGRLAAMTGP